MNANVRQIDLDNCMGSGSTGVACQNLNRNFIGIELDAGYFEIAKKRIEEANQ
jgi:site-specific DNA-methyltransferase (adenine-specific)